MKFFNYPKNYLIQKNKYITILIQKNFFQLIEKFLINYIYKKNKTNLYFLIVSFFFIFSNKNISLL